MSAKPYRPSNSTDGLIFEGRWCERCVRDHPYRETMEGDGCSILANAYCGQVPEWIEEAAGPRCIAFLGRR